MRTLTIVLFLLSGAIIGSHDGLARSPGPAEREGLLNHALFLPAVSNSHPVFRISALHYDTETPYEPDEAFQLWNVSDHAANLKGYQVGDGLRTVVFPELTVPAGQNLWCAREARSFATAFGFAPGCEYGDDSDPTVPNLAGSALRFANSGGQVLLHNPADVLVDALVYEEGATDQTGWVGPAVVPYAPTNTFPAEGQILYRKLDLVADGPIGPAFDSDSRSDWAQDPEDHLGGRRVQYAGWDLLPFARPEPIAASGMLTVALGPDNLFDAISQALASARHSIRLEAYSLEHAALAELLAAKAGAGISVTVLLEGGPVGGIEDQERHAAQQIERAGGEVWFMVNDRNAAADRYRYQHAKFAIVDERLLLVSSENLSPESMPDDDKADGTMGRRGAALITDAPSVVQGGLALFQADFDPAHHNDLFRWTATDPRYGAPPPGFEPSTVSGGDTYQLVQPAPLVIRGPFLAQLVQAPEASLLPDELGGVLGLVARAGAGDTLLVQQLYERLHWGANSDTPETAPNPRLEAYLEAARRGARVRILLDSLFDDGQNRATVDYVNMIAGVEGLDLAAITGNPTGGGVHNKMVLLETGGRGWVHVGSLNGSEASAKVNRELALQVQSDAAFAYLAAAFWHDWYTALG